MSDQDDSDFGYQTDDCESVVAWSDRSDASFDWNYKRDDGGHEASLEEAGKCDGEQQASITEAKLIQIHYHLIDIAGLPSVPTDFSITCNGFEFPVHSRLLTRHSSYFSAACDGRFKEGTEQMINLDEEHPVVVLHMVSYCYQRPYRARDGYDFRTWDVFPDRDHWSNAFSINAAVYVAADKYDITGLKTAALGSLWKALTDQRHFRDANPRRHPIGLLNDLLEVIPYIWENTTDRHDLLRDAVVNGLIADKGRLLDHMIDRPDFLELVRTVPELAVEVMRQALS